MNGRYVKVYILRPSGTPAALRRHTVWKTLAYHNDRKQVKKNIKREGRVFNSKWTNRYLFTVVDSKVLCLV